MINNNNNMRLMSYNINYIIKSLRSAQSAYRKRLYNICGISNRSRLQGRAECLLKSILFIIQRILFA